MEYPIRLAIVGCGTVAERFHAPALRSFQGFSPVVMVDRQLHRAELLKSYFPSCVAETDFTKLREHVDAAIVALPNDLNAMVATQLLQAGISVLVEKPAALNVESARELETAALKGRAKLAVGFIRREALGVRMARMFGDVRIKRFADDSRGGVETNAHIDVETQSGIPGTVELSWTRSLRNTARIVGTRGTLDVEWYMNAARLALPNGLHTLSGEVTGDCRLCGGADAFPMMFLAQLCRWCAWLRDETRAEERVADASDGRRNIELISSCRAMREQMAEPWREGVTAG